jgi:hypothetical protein
VLHPAARCVGPHRPIADLDREADHFVAQRRKHDVRQSAQALRGIEHRGDVVAHVAERLAGLDLQLLDHRAVGDTDTEPEPTACNLVQIARRRCERDRVLQIDRLDRRTELDRVRGVRDRQAQPHRIAEAGAVDSGETTLFDLDG